MPDLSAFFETIGYFAAGFGVAHLIEAALTWNARRRAQVAAAANCPTCADPVFGRSGCYAHARGRNAYLNDRRVPPHTPRPTREPRANEALPGDPRVSRTPHRDLLETQRRRRS